MLFYFFVSALLGQEIKYSPCIDCWNPDSLGNHRVVVQFAGKGPIAKVNICWRRRDTNPGQKRIIEQDAATGKKILNVKIVNITRETGTVFFEPVSGKGTYFIYYMPYIYEGRNTYYPKGVYYKPENTADAQWLTSFSANANLSLTAL